MALSGNVYGSFTGAATNQVRPQLTWTATQNVANNTSSVTVRLIFHKYSSAWPSYNLNGHNVTMTINGNSATASRVFDIRNTTSYTVYSRTVTVPHSSDGTKTFSYSASGNTGVMLGSYNFSGSGTLDTIPRASSITSFNNFTVRSGQTNSIAITLSRASSSFTHNISLRVNGEDVQSWNGQGLPTSLSISATASNRILTIMSNTTSMTAQLRVQTRSGSTNVGSVVTRNATATVHSGDAPTVSAISASEAVASIRTGLGVYVQGKSQAAISFSTSAGYGAKDASVSVSFDGRTYSSKNFTSNVITGTGTRQIAVTYKNTRGQTATRTLDLTVYPYSNPVSRITNAYRANSNGVRNDNGAHIRVDYTGSISSLNGKNSAVYRIRYKRSDASTFTEVTRTSSGNYVFPANIDYGYDIQYEITDFFGTIRYYVEVGSTFSLINFSADGKGMAFGATYDESLGGTAQFNGAVYIPNLSPSRLEEGQDLNNMTGAGFYYEPTNARASTMHNLPVARAFSLLVERHAGTKQTFTQYDASSPRTWIRNQYGGSWGSWHEIQFK